MADTETRRQRVLPRLWAALVALPVLLLAVLTAGLVLPLPYVEIAAALAIAPQHRSTPLSAGALVTYKHH